MKEKGGTPDGNQPIIDRFTQARLAYAQGNLQPLRDFNAFLDQLPPERVKGLTPFFKAISEATNDPTKPQFPESALAISGEVNPYDY